MLGEIKELSPKIRELVSQIGRVPLPLRLFIIACLFIGILVPLQAIIPGIGANINGTHLHWPELWQTGSAFVLLAMGPIHLAVPYGVLQRKQWVRPLLVCFPLIQLLPFELKEFFFGKAGFLLTVYQKSAMRGFALFLAIYVIVVAVYLYRTQSVRFYFTEK